MHQKNKEQRYHSSTNSSASQMQMITLDLMRTSFFEDAKNFDETSGTDKDDA